jgi:hypothetical protein
MATRYGFIQIGPANAPGFLARVRKSSVCCRYSQVGKKGKGIKKEEVWNCKPAAAAAAAATANRFFSWPRGVSVAQLETLASLRTAIT